MRTTVWTLAVMLCAVSAFGQVREVMSSLASESPEVMVTRLSTKPEPIKHVKTANREFWLDTSALATGWTMDTISTNQRFNWCDQHYGTRLGKQPGCFEGGGLFNGTRSTAKIMGADAAIDIGAIVFAYEWKKHVHNKYLHPLWRVPLLLQAGGHVQAAIGNWTRP
jgi:hypothetical protein